MKPKFNVGDAISIDMGINDIIGVRWSDLYKCMMYKIQIEDMNEIEVPEPYLYPAPTPGNI